MRKLIATSVLILAAIAAAAAVAAAAAPAAAEPSTFETLATDPGKTERGTGQWIVLLGKIADQCAVKIDPEVFANWMNKQHVNAMFVSAFVKKYRSEDSPMMVEWSSISQASRADACHLAVDLWGTKGSLVQGILRTPEEW